MAAIYECVSYGRDGMLNTSRTPVRASGAAFGYRRDGGDTLLLTNEHVAPCGRCDKCLSRVRVQQPPLQDAFRAVADGLIVLARAPSAP